MGFPSLSLYSIFIILAFVPSLVAGEDAVFTECSLPFNCGILRNLSYPFWGDNRPQYCGHSDCRLRCNKSVQHPVMQINGRSFFVIGINQSAKHRMMTLMRKDPCPSTLNYFLFKPANITVVNMTLFSSCSQSNLTWIRINVSHIIPCAADGAPGSVSASLRDNEANLAGCGERVEVPVLKEALDEFNSGTLNLSETLVRPFNAQYVGYDEYCDKCSRSGGRCGSNLTARLAFACYCRDRPYEVECGVKGVKGGKGRTTSVKMKKLITAIATTGIGVSLLFIIVAIIFKRKRMEIFWKLTKSNRDIEALIKSYRSLAPKRYNFSDVKKMTNSYKEKLGQGGYGDVYKGKLLDGRCVQGRS